MVCSNALQKIILEKNTLKNLLATEKSMVKQVQFHLFTTAKWVIVKGFLWSILHFLRDIYCFTTDDESTGSSQKEEEVDQRLVNFILESNDTDLLWDLRKLNSHPKNNIWFLLAQTADIYMSL